MQSTSTMKETLEGLRVILDDAAMKDIGNIYRDKLDQATTADLFLAVTNNIHDVAQETAEDAAAFETMGTLSRILLAVREVYVKGVLDGMQSVAQAINEQIDELNAQNE